MAELLVPGVWWLHGTRGSNVYLAEADDGSFALVDTGFASSAAAIIEELNALGCSLSAILLTHMHRDHAGAAGELRDLTGARLVIGRGDCYEEAGGLFLRARVGRSHIARFVFGRVQPSPPVAVDHALEGECVVLPGIVAVPVPGHTPGSYCFVVARSNVSFVGDLVISHSGTLTRSLRMANQDDAVYLESIRRFSETAPAAGFPGHGQPVLQGFDTSLEALAALPREGTNPGGYVRRVVRLFRFGRMMRTRRR
jgi:glyoxylase-like metal-dependent hydrolase (beta-lactamase superfamily II)